jgi:hypothetical protein
MNRFNTKFTLLASAIALLAAACTENADELTNGRGKKKHGTKTEGTPCQDDSECESGMCDPNGHVCTAASQISEALQCNVKPEGARSYVLFDGTKLDEKRANEGTGVNRARMKPYSVMASEYQRVLGNTPDGIKTAGASFNAAPARWYGEPVYSGVTMNTAFNIAFEGCLTFTAANADMKSAPTQDSAKQQCTSLMRKAWSRTPSPEEVDACTDLAVNKLSAETEPTRRWAYVCASILSSSQFLTY